MSLVDLLWSLQIVDISSNPVARAGFEHIYHGDVGRESVIVSNCEQFRGSSVLMRVVSPVRVDFISSNVSFGELKRHEYVLTGIAKYDKNFDWADYEGVFCVSGKEFGFYNGDNFENFSRMKVNSFVNEIVKFDGLKIVLADSESVLYPIERKLENAVYGKNLVTVRMEFI
jgi:hypothetical protein